MKYLKIENGKGLFLRDNGQTEQVDKMTKDDVLYLIDKATSTEETFEVDPFDENSIQNEAHKIIYRSLYSKFLELLENKTRFAEESVSQFKEAIEKYQAN